MRIAYLTFAFQDNPQEICRASTIPFGFPPSRAAIYFSINLVAIFTSWIKSNTLFSL